MHHSPIEFKAELIDIIRTVIGDVETHPGYILDNGKPLYLDHRHSLADRLLSHLIIMDYKGKHLHLLSDRAVAVYLIESVLLQECRLEQGAAFDDEVLTVRKGIGTYKLYYLIQTSEFFSVSNQSAGSKMPRADWNLVSQYAFHIPGEENEQQKIGSLFRRIDALITLHQREYNLRVKD